MGRENQNQGGGISGVFTFQGSAQTWLKEKIKEIMTSSRRQRTRKWPDFRNNFFEWCRVLSQSCMVESTGWSSPFSPSASSSICCQISHCWVCWDLGSKVNLIGRVSRRVFLILRSNFFILIHATDFIYQQADHPRGQTSTKYILPNVYKIPSLFHVYGLRGHQINLENKRKRETWRRSPQKYFSMTPQRKMILGERYSFDGLQEKGFPLKIPETCRVPRTISCDHAVSHSKLDPI